MIQEISIKINQEFITIFFEIDEERNTAKIKNINFAGKILKEKDLEDVFFKEISLELLKNLKQENPCGMEEFTAIPQVELLDLLRNQAKERNNANK